VPYLQPGTFTFSGPGGADINAFSASITVPAVLAFTTSPSVTTATPISRTQPLTFNWLGGGASDYVVLSVSSGTNTGTLPAGQTNSASITCLQKASMGTFTIPTWVLQALPASSQVSLGSLSQPGGAALAGIYNVSNTFSSNAAVSLANSLVLNGINTSVQ
jgi:hypothetical protein